jgi:hypothetical protein
MASAAVVGGVLLALIEGMGIMYVGLLLLEVAVVGCVYAAVDVTVAGNVYMLLWLWMLILCELFCNTDVVLR